MATVTRTTTWSDNQNLTAAALNSEYNNLLNALALVDADVSAGAAIAVTKIAGTAVNLASSQTLTNKNLTDPSNTIPTTPLALSGFAVYSTTSQVLTPSTPAKVQMNMKEYDLGTEFDAVTNFRFTATTTGKYIFTFTCYINLLATGKLLNLFVYKNGASVKQTQYHSSGDMNLLANMTVILALNATDYVEFYAQHDDSVNRSITVASGQTNTWAMGNRLS